ncbi:MAG TPA: carbon starvation protein A [Candidatus Latescibacteria bacterium]|nr:carbon starvation protein A [Candidatus Latescibacterota bacterium]|tara:strand:+ start:1724 stop:3445 length:1722 start_codon:yes stop_codon:yes gene_type:complete
MESILIIVVAGLGYLVAYNTYGRYLSRRVFGLNVDNLTPSRELEDGVDYVPTKKQVIFGHHFTSIAGTGPIVGPAIGIIWGWVPALLWVFLGSIFMGAVHDLGALVISLRHKGHTMAEITGMVMNRHMKIMFFIIVFLALLIVIAIFGMVIAIIFDMYPAAVLPVWLQIPIAIVMGRIILDGTANLTKVTAVAVAAMYGGIALGYYLPVPMPEIAGLPATGVWTVLLLIYAYIVSTLSVTTLLQPRDFINAWQLIVVMVLLVVGIFVAAPDMVAPAFNLSPEGAPPWMPFLFITIACGAISGFHCLVSSGTSSKQVETEPDARFVGYGSMLTEGFLATIVLIACGGGLALAYTTADGQVLTGPAAFATHYGSWMASSGIGSKVGAFVEGSANMIATIGLPKEIGVVLMGVFVASFAGTTLDTSVRLQRYVISELAVDLKIEALRKPHPATLLAVITAMGLAFYNGAGGKGALLLWPLFGSINQLLAGLALIVISYWLKQQGRNYIVTLLPSLIILVFTSWALTHTLSSLYDGGNIPGLLIGSIALLLQIWLTIEGLALMLRGRDTDAIPATGG